MPPITPNVRQQLHTALLSAFPTRSKLEQMVRYHLDANLNEFAADANLSTSVFELIQWAEAQGRLHKLLAGARAANPSNPALKSLRLESPGPLPAPVAAPASASTVDATAIGDPLDVYLLDGDRPFIDRNELRRSVRSLADGTDHILIVSGPPKSGRSYSFELIYHAAAARGVRVAYLNVDEEAGAALLDPDTIARRLSMEVPGAGDLPLDLGFQRANMLAQWLIAAFASSGERWWIVLDGFEHPDVPSATHDFLGRMMVTASAPGLRGRLELILLAYDPRLVPERIRPYVLIEHLAPLTGYDVGSFFKRYLEDLGTASDHRLIEEVTARAMEGLRENGLAGLNAAVVAIVRALRDQR